MSQNETRLVRFHDIYGPLGTWDGGREKIPTDLYRKIATVIMTNSSEIEIWGDREQTRSFCYVNDCDSRIYKLMRSDFHEPLNLGQNRLLTINQLADIITETAGLIITRKHIPGLQAVRARNSIIQNWKSFLGREPGISLEDGLTKIYAWIESRVRKKTKSVEHLRFMD